MKIVIDENIPYGLDAFAPLGEIISLPGRTISRDEVRNADALLVRSVTKVNASILDGSSVRFVATATIGEDHIDKDYLAARGIGFASAPGSNANSVAEYVTAALLVLAETRKFKLSHRSLGIVGHGNVGKRVEEKARALGMDCVLNDPPLARATGDPKYRPIEEILECPIITFHVPLTKEGPDATHHLVDQDLLARVRTGSIIINTSRGEVIDGNALRLALESGKVGASVLDVWENEPRIDTELLANCAIGTPHIAGYSFDGKVNGTRQIYEAACQFFGQAPTWNPASLLPEPEHPEIVVRGNADDTFDAVRNAVLTVYDIRGDDSALRRIMSMPGDERGRYFDQLRKDYPRRREFHNTRVRVTSANASIEKMLGSLGFRVEPQ